MFFLADGRNLEALQHEDSPRAFIAELFYLREGGPRRVYVEAHIPRDEQLVRRIASALEASP